MIKKALFIFFLLFPVMLYSEEAKKLSDEQKIKSLVRDFYSSSDDNELNHRFKLLCNVDKEILVKEKIIDIWAHQLSFLKLKRFKKISIKDDLAEVVVEIEFDVGNGKDIEVKSIPIYVKKELGQWKIAYLYFQPPLFTMYP